MWVGAIANFIVNWWTPRCVKTVDDIIEYEYCLESYYYSVFFYTASALSTGFLLISCVVTMLVRRHVRQRDNIPVTVCAGLDDAFCACLCTLCVQCQIMRHEGMVHGKYNLCSTTGRADFV